MVNRTQVNLRVCLISPSRIACEVVAPSSAYQYQAVNLRMAHWCNSSTFPATGAYVQSVVAKSFLSACNKNSIPCLFLLPEHCNFDYFLHLDACKHLVCHHTIFRTAH